MQSFGFKVVPCGDEGSKVPVAVAGQTMVDVQRLLTDIGEMLVRMELRIQNDVPAEILSKFDLNIGGGSGKGVGADPSEGNEVLIDDALNTLCRTLDFLGKGVVGTWMDDNYPEVRGRMKVTQDIIDLCEHLEGYSLFYGPNEDQRKLGKVDVAKLRANAEEYSGQHDGAIIGVISKDPVRKNRWTIANDESPVQISFASNISPSDIPNFAAAGPVIVTGQVIRDIDGRMTEVRMANGCYTFPEVRFHRIVTSDSDKILLNPVVGRPGYDQAKKQWTIDCEDLGISVSKASWDACVGAFHDYFMFLWDTYGGDGEFEGEEKDIQDFLRSLEIPY